MGKIRARARNEASGSLSRFVARLTENKRLDATIVAFGSVFVERPAMAEVSDHPPAIVRKRPFFIEPNMRGGLSAQIQVVQ